MKSVSIWRRVARIRRLQWLVVLACVAVAVTGVVQWLLYSGSQAGTRSTALACPEVTALQRRQLFTILYKTHTLLEQLHISHFLCYTSLWSAAQEAGPFPWQVNAQLCALNSQSLGYDEPGLLRTFRKVGLALDYSSAEASYRVTNTSLPSDAPLVEVIIFEEDPRLGATATYRRVGWKRRLLPPNCDGHQSLQCFPGSLVVLPLPYRTFGPLSLPAPRENIDLLKFHYPDTWYKPVQPDC